MEAALRTVYELITGRELPFPKLHVLPIEGFDTIKEAEIVFEDVLPDYSFLERRSCKSCRYIGRKRRSSIDGSSKSRYFHRITSSKLWLPGRMYRRWRTAESKTELYCRSSSITFGKLSIAKTKVAISESHTRILLY